jgi:hypothetical protein
MSFIYKYRVPLLLALIKFILPYLLQDTGYELHRDEYLYLAEAKHLDWGFMEVPPLLSLLAKVTQVFGDGFFWVKFWPSLFGAFTVLVICGMVTAFGGGVFAQCIASLCLIAGVYLRIHFLFQPNFLEIFWWSLIALFIVKYINTQQPSYIILIGFALSLAWLSKYSIVFFIIGMAAGIILTQNRKILSLKYFYWSVAIAVLIALPNIIWQYQHRWPVVFHMKELRETQLQFISPAAFLLDQFLMHFPYFFVWISGLIWLFFSKAGKKYSILGWIYTCIIVLLIISSGKNYYSLGAYPMLFAAGAVWIEHATSLRLTWLRYASAAMIIVLFIPLAPVLLPIWKPGRLAQYYLRSGLDKTGVLKWEDQKNHPLPQDFADMTGWKEMAKKTSDAYAALPDSLRTYTLLHCRNYCQAGAITYYGKGLPQVNTDNASFLFWMPDSYHIKNILLIAKHMPAKEDVIFQQFQKYYIIDSITNRFSREYGTKIILFENANPAVNSMISARIKKQKDLFRR